MVLCGNFPARPSLSARSFKSIGAFGFNFFTHSVVDSFVQSVDEVGFVYSVRVEFFSLTSAVLVRLL